MITPSLVITAIVAALLLVFRADVKRLVGWVVTVRRVAKTADGYAIDAGPDVPKIVDEKHQQAVIAVEPTLQLTAAPETAIDDNVSSRTREMARWVDALFDKRYDEAIAILKEQRGKAPSIDEQLANESAIGHVRFEQDTRRGIEYLEALIREHPTKPQPYHWLALSYFWRELHDKALVAIERGLALADKKVRLWDTKSDILVSLGRDSDAIVAATNGIQADPTDAANYLNLARIYERQKDYSAARASFRHGLVGTNASDQILSPYARFMSDHDFGSEAVLRYTELVSRHPESTEYLTLLGNTYLAAGLHGLALQNYHHANERANGKEAWIVSNIGNVFYSRGLYTEAIRYLQTTLEMDPNSGYAHERLAQAQKAAADENEKLAQILKEARKEGLLEIE